MHPMEEFVHCVSFLQELGNFFLDKDYKDKEVRHTLAGLFVEILLPLAGVGSPPPPPFQTPPILSLPLFL